MHDARECEAVAPSKTLDRLGHRLYPQSINAYYRCPRKFHWRYIRNVRMPFEFGPALAIGSVTHKTLAEIFRRRRDGQDGASIESYVMPYLEKERYPPDTGDALRMEHLPIIVGHVERALGALPADAEILHVEEEFDYAPKRIRELESITIAAKVDVVIRHEAGIVDHIDFKTGSQGGDPLQNYLCRVTVGTSLGLAPDQLRTVNVLTKNGVYDVAPNSRRAHENIWDIVQTQICSLSVDTEWAPRPDPAVCRWCTYRSICESAELESDSDYVH